MSRHVIFSPPPTPKPHPEPLGADGAGAHQQCHPEVIGESAEGQDGYWPLVGGALGKEGGRGVRTAAQPPTPCPTPTGIPRHGRRSPGSVAWFTKWRSRDLKRDRRVHFLLRGATAPTVCVYSVPGSRGPTAAALLLPSLSPLCSGHIQVFRSPHPHCNPLRRCRLQTGTVLSHLPKHQGWAELGFQPSPPRA